ncbi:response regulator [Mangrovimonas sp. YM274]|uniref:response regulator n=1 Tax=Mangrovimonas sp. YM274 TaxID=3070660 RepID=UPI0027DBB3F3|nr:response regulator [Mangrovimonas sp. YM274]WMI68162.1 response regulator [Mangrovimonas sp. YM274]
MNQLNILIVDDHPLIANAYKMAFEKVEKRSSNYTFNIDYAKDIDTAYQKISDSLKSIKFDLVLLDINLPSSLDRKLISGEDLGIEIKDLDPTTKIIVSTMYNNNFRIQNIIKSINPEGFLIKSDVDPKTLVVAIETVLSGSPYYDKTVLKLFRSQISSDVFVDSLDRQILYELSKGTKMVELPKLIPLSTSAIEYRKRRLKEVFNVEDRDDRVLIKEARDKGFI